MYRAAWATFKDLVLPTTKRKRKLNELTAVTVHNKLVKKGGNGSILKQIRTENHLPTQGKKKSKWSFKLPPLNMADADNTSPIVDVDLTAPTSDDVATNGSSTSNNNTTTTTTTTTTITGVVQGNNGNSTNRLNHIRNQLLLQGAAPELFDINAVTAPSSSNNNNNNQQSV